MAMTRKDFSVIAREINLSHKSGGDLIDALCFAFSRINPRFDKSKFLAACCDGITVSGPSVVVPSGPTVKVGDKVRVVNTDWSKGQWYKIGDEGVVTEVRDEDPAGGWSTDIFIEGDGTWICRDYELEVIG